MPVTLKERERKDKRNRRNRRAGPERGENGQLTIQVIVGANKGNKMREKDVVLVAGSVEVTSLPTGQHLCSACSLFPLGKDSSPAR
jgi:hypothetical protein